MVLQEEKVDSSLEFLILASDGLWDVVSNEVCYHFHFLFFFSFPFSFSDKFSSFS